MYEASTILDPALMTISIRTIGFIVAAVALVGCASSSRTENNNTNVAPPTVGTELGSTDETGQTERDPLAGTKWRLVEFQSMSDAIGEIRPKNPSDYTLTLGSDGRATMRLDCNRATGSWSAEVSSDGYSGTFSLGPLAATNAVCPAPSMGEQIARDAPYVRGFLLRDNRLYLSLLADGGIYAWQRESPVAFETQRDPALQAALLRASPDYTRNAVETGGMEARYAYGRVDLNGDGTEEVLAILMGSVFCGTGGCNLLLLKKEEAGYTVINAFPISRLPIIVSDHKTAGWADLLRPEHGGGAERSYVKHVFDGSRYVEAERLPADVTPEGTWLLTGEYAYETGIRLTPQR